MVLFCEILLPMHFRNNYTTCLSANSIAQMKKSQQTEFCKHINKGKFTMRITIVDDISEERTLLHNRLDSQFSRRNVHVDIFEYGNG